MAGKLVHFEISTKDADKAVGFWSGVFDWQFGESAMPGMEYRMTQTIPDVQGGAIFQTDQAAGGPLTIYFDTDDIDASIAKIRELGGSADDKQPIPGIGWFTAAKDPEGNTFSLYQTDESAPPPQS
jgi:predicted enzyme related to lactoylglutathione lyase